MKEYNHTSEEDNLILFYNKYLNAGKVGEDYFFKLIENYVDAWQEKMKNVQKLEQDPQLLGETLGKLKISEEDIEAISYFDHDFQVFYQANYIRINEDYGVIVDAYANILRFAFYKDLDLSEVSELYKYINKNIFTLLSELERNIGVIEASEQAENMILQNLLVSKLEQAVYSIIKEKNGDMQASLFAVANAEIFDYENRLADELDYEAILKSKQACSRSRR